MREANGPEVSNLLCIRLLRNKDNMGPVELAETSPIADIKLMEHSHDLVFDDRPHLLIESSNKPVWPRRPLRVHLFNRAPYFLFSEDGIQFREVELDHIKKTKIDVGVSSKSMTQQLIIRICENLLLSLLLRDQLSIVPDVRDEVFGSPSVGHRLEKLGVGIPFTNPSQARALSLNGLLERGQTQKRVLK